MKVLEAHCSELVYNHIHNLVASTEMMMERYSHAVAQSRAAYCLLKCDEFGTLALQFHTRSNLLELRLNFVIYTLAHCLGHLTDEGLSFFQCAHAKSSSLITPEAMARSITR